ncbi:MAG TPA: hypothetical protein PKE04_05380 [Clostridia bacterium]|nr:hypothetical protein [Clostridia bacterium]
MTDWIRDALDTIRAAVRAEFPVAEIPDLHINQMPQGFRRPALYVQPIPDRTEWLTASLMGTPSSWQVVYFPKEDNLGMVDNLALLAVADRMTNALGRVPTLTSPAGVTYDVTDFSYDLRDGLGFFTADLWTSMRLEEPAAEPMRGITLELNTKE